MRILLTILFIGVLAGSAQKQIPATTTVAQFVALPQGTYYFVTGTDSVFVTGCAPTVIIRTPVCPTPIPCPVQRVAVGFVINKAGQVVTTYSDGSTSVFTLKNSVIVN